MWLFSVLQKEQPQYSVQGATYHGSGLADGHQASEEVFIMQLAEHMGVIGYHNGDFFHHLSSCYFFPSSTPDYSGKNSCGSSVPVHTPTWDPGAECQNPERESGGKKEKAAALEGLPSSSPLVENEKWSLIYSGSIHHKHLLHSQLSTGRN